MNYKNFYVPSIYTRWDGLSQKTISRYCPFKLVLTELPPNSSRWLLVEVGVALLPICLTKIS